MLPINLKFSSLYQKGYFFTIKKELEQSLRMKLSVNLNSVKSNINFYFYYMLSRIDLFNVFGINGTKIVSRNYHYWNSIEIIM